MNAIGMTCIWRQIYRAYHHWYWGRQFQSN